MQMNHSYNPSLSPRRNEEADRTDYGNPIKRILILSSTEGYSVGLALKRCLEQFGRGRVEVTLWDRTRPNGWLLEHILGQIRRFPFVVLVLTPDDQVVTRGYAGFSPRDNLLMELGIALATNEYDHTFVLHPDDTPLKLPTNIQGWIRRTYHHRTDNNDEAAIDAPAKEIVEAILDLKSEMSWDLFLQQIEWLHLHTMQNPVYKEGLRPNIVVGVNMGGMLAGSLLYYKNRNRFHLMTVWTKDESACRTLSERQRDFQLELREVIERIRERGDAPRILLIDDSDKSGEAMNRALVLTKEVAPEALLKTAALVYLGQVGAGPDYCHLFDYQRFKYAPI
jgi:predicted nucleotide-binding protein/hypoxanthine phosphoribosyltransferase